MDTLTEFKRMNFFTGFFTTAEDWNQGQAYHLEKRKLHNRGLHTPGILCVLQEPAGAKPVCAAGRPTNLAVSAAGGLTVRVSPGAALDSEGNLIVLAQPCEKALPPDSSGTAYLAIKYADKPTDPEENVEDPDFSGSKLIVEIPQIDFMFTPPDQKTYLELARIDLQAPVGEIKDPANWLQPQANEINRLHVQWAGSVDPGKDEKLDALQERLEYLHTYHLEMQQRHNRGLFKAGIMRGMLDEFRVVPAGGLKVHVKPGVALDDEGHEIYLEAEFLLTLTASTATPRVYIAARYENSFSEYVKNLATPFADTMYRTAYIAQVSTKPNNYPWIELASLDLEANAAEVRLPADPGHPQPNEIDQRPLGLEWAAALAVAAPTLPASLRERIGLVMRNKRRAFAALDTRFPVPSAADVRQTALNLETLARNDSLKAETLPEVLTMLKALEQDVSRDIADPKIGYPPLVEKQEYKDYVAAVAALHDALYAGEQIDVVLNRQENVTEAAETLAKVVFKAPAADAGPDQTVASPDDEAPVTLDASGSQAFDDQHIVTYRWEKEQ